MKVEILDATPRPDELVSYAAGICYGKDDYSLGRIEHCYGLGHGSPFEHVKVTLEISELSRACTHQWVRHRLASYNQHSQRYCDQREMGYIVPPSIQDNWEALETFNEAIATIEWAYDKLLTLGIKREDARYILPEANETKILVTMNLWSLYHFLRVRTEPGAQWEIKEIAWAIHDALKEYGDGWDFMMGLFDEDR